MGGGVPLRAQDGHATEKVCRSLYVRVAVLAHLCLFLFKFSSLVAEVVFERTQLFIWARRTISCRALSAITLI